MLKSIILAAALVLSTAPASADEATDRCGEAITWRSVRCAVALASVQAHFVRAERFERNAKHSELEGDTNGAQRWRNKAAFERAEGKRLDEAHRRNFPRN